MKAAEASLAREHIERQIPARVALDEPNGARDAALGVDRAARRALRLAREAHRGGGQSTPSSSQSPSRGRPSRRRRPPRRAGRARGSAAHAKRAAAASRARRHRTLAARTIPASRQTQGSDRRCRARGRTRSRLARCRAVTSPASGTPGRGVHGNRTCRLRPARRDTGSWRSSNRRIARPVRAEHVLDGPVLAGCQRQRAQARPLRRAVRARRRRRSAGPQFSPRFAPPRALGFP